MNRRSFLAGSLSGAAAVPVQGQPQPTTTRSNVIWLFADQHRAQALSASGDPNACTPNLDNMRELGVNFSNAVSGMHGSQGMFRETNPYEESVRVPFIIGGEQPTYNGRRTGNSRVMLNHVDIAPTTLGLCGIEKPGWMVGADFSSQRLAHRKAPSEPDSAYLQNVVPTGHGNSINRPYRGLVTKQGWKFVCFEGVPWLLFNLNEDPFEQANLAQNNAFRAERQKLSARLKQWVSDTGDRFEIPAE